MSAERLPIGRGAEFVVDRDARIVWTRLATGQEVAGTRDVTHDNIAEARRQGYEGTDEQVVWQSLVEHELMHTLCTRALWDCESHVLRDLAGVGGPECPFAVRMHEEALVISLQHWLCSGVCHRVLDHVETEVFESALAARELAEPLL